jgi:toxin ParE1/3/4
MKTVRRRRSYLEDLRAIRAWIAKENTFAARDLWLHIDDQVTKLTDPNFPRRKGRVAGTRELVAHENYIVILIESDSTVDAINVVHAKRQYP